MQNINSIGRLEGRALIPASFLRGCYVAALARLATLLCLSWLCCPSAPPGVPDPSPFVPVVRGRAELDRCCGPSVWSTIVKGKDLAGVKAVTVFPSADVSESCNNSAPPVCADGARAPVGVYSDWFSAFSLPTTLFVTQSPQINLLSAFLTFTANVHLKCCAEIKRAWTTVAVAAAQCSSSPEQTLSAL